MGQKAKVAPYGVKLIFCLAFYVVSALGTALAQEFAANFDVASRAFSQIPLNLRYDIQTYLVAAGFLDAVSNESYNSRIYQAILSFQSQSGQPRTGIVDGQQLIRLQSMAEPHLARWRLTRVLHPATGTPLWVPFGLGLSEERTADGLSYAGPGGFSLKFNFVANVGLSDAFGATQRIFADLRKQGITINYQTAKPDFFVIQAFGPELEIYWRFSPISSGVIGFAIAWKPSQLPNGNYLTTIISDLFRAYYSLRQNRGPPQLNQAALNIPPPPQVSEVQEHHDEEPGDQGKTGTGFFVSDKGHILTNAHVIEGCSVVTVSSASTSPSVGRVVARDKINDLALIETSLRPTSIASFRLGARIGEPVAVYGFPLAGLLATTGNFTIGNISATAGLADDTRMLQISAPVQPGNSGGPLLDEAGNVVGVIVAKLNALSVSKVANDIPQNVNFAIKSSLAVSFLETNSVSTTIGDRSAKLATSDLAEKAKSIASYVVCQP